MNAIERAIGQRLTAMPDCPPIAWPNKDFAPNGTYIEFRHAPNERRDDTVDGIGAYQIGLVLLTVVSAKNDYTTEANSVAEAVMAHFPKGLRLDAGTVTVLVSAPVNPGTAFPDGAYWRQPLTLSYLTED